MKTLFFISALFLSSCSQFAPKRVLALQKVQELSLQLHEAVVEFNRGCIDEPIIGMPCQMGEDHVDTTWYHAVWATPDTKKPLEIPDFAELRVSKDGRAYWGWESGATR